MNDFIIEASDIKITLGKYSYSGGFGQNWHSDEKNVELGDVRIIDNVLHYAFMLSKSEKNFFKGMNTVSWARADKQCGRSVCLILNIVKPDPTKRPNNPPSV